MTRSTSISDLCEAARSALDFLENKLDFRSISVLGKGTYGSVVKVISNEGEPLAAKIVQNRSRNEMEVTVWPKLLHPNVLKLVDIVQDFDDVTIFLTDIMRSSLFVHLQSKELKEDPNAVDRCRTYARDVFCGLSYLHRRNLCHLDLRTDNILLTENDRAVVADFSGLCWADPPKRFCPLPRSLRPPEMLTTHRRHVFPKYIDLWSCGLLLANLFLGRGYYSCVPNSRLAGQIEGVYEYTQIFQYEPLVTNFFNETYSSSTLSHSSRRDFMDLVQRFLQMNPRNRLQAEQALMHPFLLSVRKGTPSQLTLEMNNPDGTEDGSVENSEDIEVESREESVKEKLSDDANKAVDGKKVSKWRRYKKRLSKLKRSISQISFLKSMKFKKEGEKKAKISESQETISGRKSTKKEEELL